MDFTDFTRKLALGQLKNTAAVDDQDLGEINPGHEDQLLELTNQGLTDISTRMKLFENMIVLTFVEGQNIYTLDQALDAELIDFVRLLSVHGVHKDLDNIPENEKVFVPKTSSQITMPSPFSVRFTDAFMTDYAPAVDLKFQARHPVLLDPTGTMNLPHHLYETLALYVAGLYLSQMGGEENTAKGDSYYGLYLKMMNDDVIDNKSQSSELLDEDVRFNDRGFV
ncbi:structural protein, N4 gp67-like protein [Roseovarius Plymouth podovirus 1]|uniref:Structural protein, N4 gp67-like protein n=2 Tax=Roseovarius Plymouth podovirus 1 TaxID=926474 RepID=K4Q5A4_9CAUD|nr:virion structural protein [Roseovarius Plymouth podovirus 1]CBW47071.1 strutural, N4 gp67-like protein [Roseovarius sp. 217 phage 1]CBX88007.1 structural protein, N4 gp67-like protein [Roseovarius Plymouth podovirus 1]